MTNIDRLNINNGGQPVSGYTGSSAVFGEVGALVGGALPDAYIDFIRKVDGGHPEVGCFPMSGGRPDDLMEVAWFYSFANPNLENIKAAINGWAELLGPLALPICHDGGGNQVYLLLGPNAPSVWLYLHDENAARVKLADCFEDFLSGLVTNPDFV